jgi:hypothetical protein
MFLKSKIYIFRELAIRSRICREKILGLVGKRNKLSSCENLDKSFSSLSLYLYLLISKKFYRSQVHKTMDSCNIFSFTYLLPMIFSELNLLFHTCPSSLMLAQSSSATSLLEQIQPVQIACYVPGRKAYFHLCVNDKDLEGVLIGLLL